MAAFKTRIFAGSHGAGLTEVLLSMAIIAMATPFIYTQISNTNHEIADMAHARAITDLRSTVFNFVRLNQENWPATAQIRMDDADLAEISSDAIAGFIDKYPISGATTTDVYLVFPMFENEMRTARIARHIGTDAAVVDADGIAYGSTWAAAAPDFQPGNLVYRVTRDIEGEDRSKYLHRGTSGDDELNVMQRDLNMGGYGALNIGTMLAGSTRVSTAAATFVDADDITAESVYFSDGANMDGGSVEIGSLRVTGDIMGFRNIYATTLNKDGFGTSGRVIVDRATISNSVNVSRNLVLKSENARTISGFTGINANTVFAPFISAEEMIFYEKFGLTVSGELMMSTTQPLKIGSWSFPSTTPPRFSEITFSRARIPDAPRRGEFAILFSDDWQTYNPNPVLPGMGGDEE